MESRFEQNLSIMGIKFLQAMIRGRRESKEDFTGSQVSQQTTAWGGGEEEEEEEEEDDDDVPVGVESLNVYIYIYTHILLKIVTDISRYLYIRWYFLVRAGSGGRHDNLSRQIWLDYYWALSTKLIIAKLSLLSFWIVRIQGGNNCEDRSRWTCGLRRGSAAARLLELRVRIPPGAWLSVLWVLSVVR
jgi:hypothetical protein